MTSSKKTLLALLALIVIIVYIAVTFRWRRELGWWDFDDCFILFMSVFTWVMSLLVARIIHHSGKVLSNMALVFGVLFVIALIAEYIVYTALF